MPLPQPRGPVSVRVCGYRRGMDRFVLDRQRVLDPTRTAWLAARLDEPGGRAVTPAVPPAGCGVGDRPAVLVFRYAQGPPVLVDVTGGPCAMVSTTARLELGRDDVVSQVAGLLSQL